MNKKIAKTFCYQLDHSDCGVACLLSIIKYHNGHNTIENLRELSGTSKEGTTLLGLYQTAIKLNFEASGNEADLETLILNTNPLILHVVIDGHLQHYVVCYGFINEKFIIGDPAKGIVSYSKDELNKIWISKTCLKLKPTENFVKRSDIKKSKRNWFFNLIKQDIQILNISVLIGFGIALLGMAMAIFSQKLIDDILPSKEANKLIFGLALLTVNRQQKVD